jgi:hypothetical protein
VVIICTTPPRQKSIYLLMMNDEVILSFLEELAEKLEILVRDENINIEESSSSGGLCRVEGKYVIILNSKATVKEKIQVMIAALQTV